MDLVTIIAVLEKLFASHGYLIVFLSSFVEMSPIGWVLPGGVVVAVAGFFAYGDPHALVSILFFGWLGSWITFLLAYLIGAKTGDFLIKRLKQQKNAARARTMLKRHGGVILTTSMLAGLTRFWVAYVAGMQRYNLLRFLFYSTTAALTWTSLQAVIGFFAGAERGVLEKGISGLGILSWLLLGIALFAIYRASKEEFEEFKEEK